jgi:hypothetical protein
MKAFRRICALGVSGLVVGAMMSGVAATSAASAPLPRLAADTPEVFAGTASAQALKLSLFGTNLTLGSTNAEADSTPKAHADGAGIALITSTVSSADATGANQSAAPPKACGLSLPIPSIAAVFLACSLSSSSTNSAAPAAVAGSNIANLDVGALNLVLSLLQPIINTLTPILNQVIGTVTTLLQPVLGPVNTLLAGLGLNLQQPVSSLLTALERATNLVTIHVGDNVSAVTTSGSSVIADASAQGAEIDVLPGIQLTGGPLLSITVGSAHTTSTFNRATGVNSATFDPSILTIKLLGITIPIKLGAPLTLFAGTALESTISLGAGSTKTNADGSMSAVADGVGLDLLKGLNGGIGLHLAHAESGVGGHVATVTPTTTAASTTTTSTTVSIITGTVAEKLATTGTEAPLLPVGLALLLLGYLTRRTLLRRRTPRTPR